MSYTRMKYVSYKNRKGVMDGLKGIYKASTIEEAEVGLQNFEKEWGKQYPLIVKSWKSNWEYLTRFFDYPMEIRRIMYTTNTIEGFNRQLRKYTKHRGAFPNDDALMKVLYLSASRISKKWVVKPAYWGHVSQQLSILFEDRFVVS